MKIALGFDKILYWFDPLAPALWSGHNSLRGLCKIFCQPDFHGKVVAVSGPNNQGSNETRSLAPYLTKSAAQIQLGVPFTREYGRTNKLHDYQMVGLPKIKEYCTLQSRTHALTHSHVLWIINPQQCFHIVQALIGCCLISRSNIVLT
jgi:hypothetical protein